MYATLERRILPDGPGRRIFALFGAATVVGLFRAVNQQPKLSLTVHGTSASLVPGDFGFLAVTIALMVFARKPLLAGLRRNRVLTAAMTLFALWLLVSAAHNGLSALVSGVKVVEPAALGLGAIALLDTEDRLGALIELILGLTIVADIVGVYDYIAHGGGRVNAFLGIHDFSAVATLPLLVVLAGLFVPGRWDRRMLWVAGVTAWLGLAMTAALASLVSLVLGVAVLLVLAWRHHRLAVRPVVLTVVIVAAVVGSTLMLRHNDIGFIYKWVGKKETSRGQFESGWSQRLIFVYVGGRMFLDRPITGTGWWGEPPPSTFARFIPDARRRFPDNPPRYFPPTNKPFIPQQTYDEVLFELGLIGAVLLLTGFVAAARTAIQTNLRLVELTALDFVPALWFASLIGALAGEGLFGGIPLATLFWLTLGLTTYNRQREAA